MKVQVIPCGPAVNESERKAIEYLKSSLISEPGDDEWLLLTNLAFSATHHRQSDEIDIIAIGPPGVQVIEVKHWTAAWINRNLDIVDQEADRVTLKARKIGTTLRHRVTELPRVDGTFLMTTAPAKVAALEQRDPIRGVSLNTFKTWRTAIGFHSQSVLSLHQIRALGRCLEPRSGVFLDGELKRLGGYTRLQIQSPPNEWFHRVYKATHASRQDQVVLHLYDMSASDGSKTEEKAQREWKSLQRLQRYLWAPRIVDSFQEAPGYTGEVTFFTVADPAAPSIEERADDDSWDVKARLSFARSVVRALGELHEAGTGDETMIHRNLRPGTILVKHDNSPILTGFEYARIPADITVTTAGDSQSWDATTSPEVRAQGRAAADSRSDVYSLCASLMVLLRDCEDDIGVETTAILARGMHETPEKRLSLSQLDVSLSELLGETIPEPPPPPARFWTEDQIVTFRNQNFRIVSRLGSGGVGTTFKVIEVDRKTKNDLGTYLAKVVRDENTGNQVLHSYKLARPHLWHSALSTIFEVAPEWRDNSFVALMTWVEGEPLSEYAGVLPILADDLHETSDDALACRWLRTACEALQVLHSNGLVHGDLSPRNIIVSGTDIVLTDYDCVTKVGARAIMPGTVIYCSPSFHEGRNASLSDDLYALAASFFHILFDKEPFQYEGALAKEHGLNWNGVERSEFKMLAAFLDRATNPDPEKRFATATDAVAALKQYQTVKSHPANTTPVEPYEDNVIESASSADDGEEKPERTENKVLWLKWLLQSYPGALWGNSETRGLDTDFTSKTYVETDLEQMLYRDIMERRVRLVVLCGNAGDGKTALLQHLAQRLGLGDHTSATRILKGRLDDGLMVRMNLDGSASWQGRSADELLDEFMRPFQGGLPTADIVHLLAINDGRLLEWIENFEESRGETPLTSELLSFLEDSTPPRKSHIRFVNLNQRSLVGAVATNGESIDNRFLERLTDSLYGGEDAMEIWTPCKTCVAQERCEVFRAMQIFGPAELADESVRTRARQRLFDALQGVHLRGETHITVRELRAALIYILFGIHYCSDYHAYDDVTGLPIPKSYSERAFSSESDARQGEVLRELARFDPALEAHPQVDRRLQHPPVIDGDSGLPHYEGLSLKEARRRAYFEWPAQKVKQLTKDPNALDLAQGRHLREFRELAINSAPTNHGDLAKRLCSGISRLENLPPQALERPNAVPLKITPRTPTETAFWVEKSINDFRLAVDLTDVEGLDQLHRQVFLIYRYRDGRDEHLRLGAELFHLLLELADGYQLGDVATDDTFAQLSIFVQRLVQEDHRNMFAWNPMREDTIFEISTKIDDTGFGSRQHMVIALPEKMGESNGD